MLFSRFGELCRVLPAHALPPGLEAQLGERERSYASVKRLAGTYQQRKAAFLQHDPFREWVVAPAGCEAFTGLEEPTGAASLPLPGTAESAALADL